MLGSTWYGPALGIESVAPPAGGRLRRYLAGATLLNRARSFDLIVTQSSAPGAHFAALALAIVRRRKLVILEFVPGHRPGGRAWLGRAFWRATMRHCVHRAQVMTAWEVDAYSRYYRTPSERFVHIPWPLEKPSELPSAEDRPRVGVAASGRTSCDWATLFEAAEGQGWSLTVICGAKELNKVRRLATNSDARILTDISTSQHFEVINAARVFAMPLSETYGSNGHVRLMVAIAARTPAVVSSIRGLEGYLDYAAASVPPGDPLALRHAINELLANPAQAAEAAARAARLPNITWSRYFAEIKSELLGL